MPTPRVAIIGVWLESNRQAPVAKEDDFKSFYQLEGRPILDAARAANPLLRRVRSRFIGDGAYPRRALSYAGLGRSPTGDALGRSSAGAAAFPVARAYTLSCGDVVTPR